MSNPTIYASDGISKLTTEDPDAVSDYAVSTMFNSRSGLAKVNLKIKGVEHHLSLAEARALGLELVVKSESALCNAAALQLMMAPDAGNMPLEFAIQAWGQVCAAVLSRHIQSEVARNKKAVEQELTDQATEGEHGAN